MKPSLASWGLFLLMGPAAALSKVGAAKCDGGLVWDGYVKEVVASCYEDYQVATAAGIFTTFLRPLLCEMSLEDNDDVVCTLRGGGSSSNKTNTTENNKIVRIVRELRGGTSDCNNLIHFTNFTFVAADEQCRDEEEAVVQLSQPSETLLNKFLDGPDGTPDAPDSKGNTCSTGNTSSIATNSSSTSRGGSKSSSSSSSTINTSRGNNDNTSNTSDADDPRDTHLDISPTKSFCSSGSIGSITSTSTSTTTSRSVTDHITNSNSISKRSSSDTIDPEDTLIDSSGVDAAFKSSKERPFISEINLPPRVLPDMFNQITTNRHETDDAVSHLSGGSSPNNVTPRHSTLDDFKKIPSDKHIKNTAMSKSELLEGSEHNHLIEDGAMFCPRDLWVRRPNFSLEAGDNLMGNLRSAEEGSKLWPGDVDSSFSFSYPPAPFSTEDTGGRGTNPGMIQSTSRLDSDPEKSRMVVFTQGETLTGTLRPAEERLRLWPGVDGSRRFEKYPGTPSSTDDAGGGGTEPGMIRPLNLLTSDREMSPEMLNTLRTVLQGEGGGGQRAGPKAQQSTYLPSALDEKIPEVPSTQRIVIRGPGGAEEGVGPGVILPMNQLSLDPKSVGDILRTRKIVLEGEGSGGERAELGDMRPMNVQASNPENAREVLATPITESGAMRSRNLLSSNSKHVREVVTTRRAVYQKEDGKLFETNPQKVPEVMRMQETALGEEGGKGSDSAGDRKGTVGGWLPWARRNEGDGLDHIFAATTDKEGPMGVSVPKRGSVLVTVDGSTTISRSGHFQWDWVSRLPWKRPEDNSFKMKVTEEPRLEFRLGGRTVYAVSEYEWMG